MFPKTPRPYLYVVLFFSILLNLTGLASIVDGVVVWANFIKDFIEQYQIYVRGSLAEVFRFIWPADWPFPPNWFFDLIIVWSSFYAAFRVFMVFEPKNRRFNYRFLGPSWVPLFLGPLVPIVYWLRLRRFIGQHRKQLLGQFKKRTQLSDIGKKAIVKRLFCDFFPI